MIQLRILGPIDLRTADGRELRSVLQQPKRLALLAYLALAGPHHFRRRDAILGLFWPELDEERARRALRQALRFLRASTDDGLITERGRDELTLDPNLFWCDAVECSARLGKGKAADALALYRGDLLDGLLVTDAAPELEQWIAGERATLRRRAAEAAAQLSNAGGNGQGSDALTWARRAFELAPDDEGMLRRLVVVLEAQGNRMGALKAYDEFAERLAREFAAEPSSETRAVIERIRAPDERSPVSKPLPRLVESPVPVAMPLPVAVPIEPSTRRRPGHIPMLVGGGLVVAAILLAISAIARGGHTIALGRRTAIAVAPELERWPALSFDGTTIFYTVSGSGGDELVVQQVNGDAPIVLTSHLPGSQRFGALSPDGKTLLFHADDGLYLMPALGGQARRIAVERSASGSLNFQWVLPGSWAPDGTRIVYPDHDTLYIQGIAGSDRAALATGRSIHSPAWSPDGKWVAYVEGNPGFHLRGNIAPSEVRVVAVQGGKVVVVAAGSSLNTSPTWVPGGHQLLFVSDREGGRDIYSVELNSGGTPRDPPVRITTGLNPERLSLSADGHRLAWSVFTETANIRIVEADAVDSLPLSGALALTSGSQIVEAVSSISPDGEWLYYHSDRSGNPDLWRVPLAGGHPVQLTTDSAGDFAPQISPDGKEVAFHSLRTGSREIFLMPAAGGAAVQVSTGPGDDAGPLWLPAGDGLMWQSGDSVVIARRSSDGKWSAPVALWAAKPPGGWVQFSPDGQWMSSPLPAGLELVNQATGTTRILAAAQGVGWHAWSEDGDTIYGVRTRDGRLEIIAIPLAGGPPRVVAYADHPANQQPRYGILYAKGRLYFPLAERSVDVWVAEVGNPLIPVGGRP